MRDRFCYLLWTPVVVTFLSSPAFCDVTNPGFETGDLTGWTLGGDTSCMGVVPVGSSFFVANGVICGGLGSSIVHSGNYAAYLGSENADGMLSQAVPTVPGGTYDINFWLASLNLGTNVPNDFSVTWDGSTVLSSTNLAASPFTDYSFPVMATGPTSTLTFAERNEFSYFVLDDVAVTPGVSAVPEPRNMEVTGGILMVLIAAAMTARYRTGQRRCGIGRKVKAIPGMMPNGVPGRLPLERSWVPTGGDPAERPPYLRMSCVT